MRAPVRGLPRIILALMMASWGGSLPADDETLDQDCVMRLALSGEASMTLDQLRDQCAVEQDRSVQANEQANQATPPAEAVSPLEQRLAAERQAASSPFSILAHRPN